jgi:glycosyltransferase involved in cell wall biosynthesis
MNILYLTEAFDVGGSTTFAKNLTQELVELGHSLTLITFSQNEDISYNSFSTENYINIAPVNGNFFAIPRKTLLLFKSLRKLFGNHKTKQIDLVICDLLFPLISYTLIKNYFSSLRNSKTFYIFHIPQAREAFSEEKFYRDKYAYIKFRIKESIEIFFLNRTDVIIAASKYSKDLLNHTLKVQTKVAHLYPGREKYLQKVNLNINKIQARKTLGLSKNKKIVLLITRLEPRKGIFDFLTLLKKSEPKFSNHLFIIASNFVQSFHNTYNCFNLLSSLHIKQTILWFSSPERERIAQLYKAADVLVMPSIDLETFGFVTLESMMMGLPVVAFDIGANNELIEKKWLTPIENKEQILTKMKQVLSLSPVNYKKYSNELIKKSKKFSWEKFSRELVKLAQE